MGLHNYHDTMGTFPSGHRLTYNGSAQIYYTNWAILILPYIEQNNLYMRYYDTLPNIHANSQFVREQYVPTYACPSDVNANKLLVPETGANTAATTASPTAPATIAA